MAFLETYGTVIGVVVLIAVFSSLKPKFFPTVDNGVNILKDISLLCVIASGLTIIMIMMEFDLSIGSMASFAGVLAAGLTAEFGTFLGLMAGYVGGRTDALIMRIADIQLSFPAILIALVIMALWGQGLFKIIIAISVVNWVFYARTARGSTLSEREKDYVDAARATGVSTTVIMVREILPNIVAPVIVIATVRIAHAIILESTLSFLGLGVPITEPSLGSLINEGYQVLFSGYWWITIFPGLGLMLIVLGINQLGDRLRDVLNPRLKR